MKAHNCTMIIIIEDCKHDNKEPYVTLEHGDNNTISTLVCAKCVEAHDGRTHHQLLTDIMVVINERPTKSYN